MSNSQSPKTRHDKHRKITVARLVAGGVAVAGIGAAITMAAWTNQAWFTTEASAASIELYGALGDEGTCPAAEDASYVPAEDLVNAVSIGLDPFENLVPDDSRTTTICLWNGSNVGLSVSLTPIDVTGDPVFGSGGATIGVEDEGEAFATQTLDAGAVKPLEVVVTTPNTWDDDFQGAESGVLQIIFTGSTDL